MHAWCWEKFAINSSVALRTAHSTAHARVVVSAVSAKQIRAILPRTLDCLFSAPLCDLSVISRKQNLRDFPAAKFCWTRVLRCFEPQTFRAQAIIHRRLLVAKRAW